MHTTKNYTSKIRFKPKIVHISFCFKSLFVPGVQDGLYGTVSLFSTTGARDKMGDSALDVLASVWAAKVMAT